MSEREDLLRVDATGTVHPVGRTASQELRARTGEWRLMPGPGAAVLLRPANPAAVLRLAGEIRAPGALYDVIAMIAQTGWTGELVVYGEDSVRSIYFDSGNVVGATTNVPEERLGETLYRFGVVTREQLEKMVAAASQSGKRVGEAAIDLEFVSSKDIYPMMARQVEEVFYKSLHVSDGLFFFFDRYDEKLVRRFNLQAGALLMEGARRMDEMRFFRQKVPNDTYVPLPTSSRAPPPEELQAVYAQCDGTRSIAEIGRRIGQLEFEVTRAVFQLLSGGWVNIVAPRPKGAEAIVSTFNPALAEIHRTCDEAGRAQELRDGLARFASGTGMYEPLFMMAGPREDGTLRPDRIAKNVTVFAGADPEAWLVQELYEYVGFALFHAGSLVSREVEAQLNAKVAELLRPLRIPDGPPPSRRASARP
jgi:Domain of unknown function (DUF4388)